MKGEFEKDFRSQSLKPLAVPVKTAGNLLGVSTTTTWGLISKGKIDVIRIGRRTLVTMASLESLVARLASYHQPEELGESRTERVEEMDSIKMTLEELKSQMSAAGLTIASETRLPNNRGTHIVTATGQVADAYDSGTLVIHGRDAAGLRKALRVDNNNNDSGGPDK